MPPLLLLSAACLLGLFWAGVPEAIRWLGAIPIALLCLAAGRGPLALLLALAFVAGLLRGATLPPPILQPAGAATAAHDFTGVVDDYPEPRGAGERLAVQLASMDGAPAGGRVLVQTARPEGRRYGDRVSFEATLRPLAEVEPAGWRDYLMRQGFAATAFAGATRRLANAQGNPLVQGIATVRDRLGASLDRYFPDPENALARGLMLGDRGTYSPELTEALRRSGLSHVIAVSGYNVVLVAGSAWAVAGAIFGRRPALWLAVPAIAAYAVLTGWEPPVIRAALMTSLAGLGWWLGRPVHLPTLLLFGAVVLGLHNPRILGDLSFLLSFAATAGLVWLFGNTPDEAEFDAGWAGRLARAIRDVVLATVVASLATAPLILGSFGTLSLVAPISNLLVAPLIPAATFGSIAVAVAGLVGDLPAVLLAIPVAGVLQAILGVAEIAGTSPGATIEWPGWRPEWAWPVYGAMALFVWWRETAGAARHEDTK